MTDPTRGEIALTNARRATFLARNGRPEAARKALAKAFEFAETELDRADAEEARAHVAKTEGDDRESLDAWYQHAGSLRAILDGGNVEVRDWCDELAEAICEGEGRSDSDGEAARPASAPCRRAEDLTPAALLTRFARARLNIAQLHSGLGECVRAANALDEAIGRLWDVASEGELRAVLDECLVLRATELLHCGRVHEAVGIAHDLRAAAGSMEGGLRARAWAAIGNALKVHENCEDAADAFEQAAELFAAEAKFDGDVAAGFLASSLDHGIERQHAGDHERAAAVLAGAIESAWAKREESPAWRNRLAEGCATLGEALEKLERCAEAVEAFEKECDLRAGLTGDDASRWEAAQAFARLADSRSHLRDFEKAQEALDRAFELGTGEAMLLESLHRLQARIFAQQERCDDAAASYESAAKISREAFDAVQHVELARAMFGLMEASSCCGPAERVGAAGKEGVDALLAAGSDERFEVAALYLPDLARFGLAADAARLIEGLAGAGEAAAPFLDACRGLEAGTLRAICRKMSDRGVALRLALGRREA